MNGCTSGAGLGTTNGRFPVAMTGGAKYTGVLPREKILQVLPRSVQSKTSMFHSRKINLKLNIAISFLQ
jgi:hypothetical protein